MPVVVSPLNAIPSATDWPPTPMSVRPLIRNNVDRVATRSGMRATTIRKLLNSPTASPAEIPISIAGTPPTSPITMAAAAAMIDRLIEEPTDRSKPPTVIDTVQPSPITATIDAAWRMNIALMKVRKKGCEKPKYAIMSTNTVSSPYR